MRYNFGEQNTGCYGNKKCEMFYSLIKAVNLQRIVTRLSVIDFKKIILHVQFRISSVTLCNIIT